MISWSETKDFIWTDTPEKMINGATEVPSYCDSEINGKVPKNYFKSITRIIETFVPTKQGIKKRKINSTIGKCKSTCRWYENEDYRLELWINNENKDDYGFIFGPKKHEYRGNFLICSVFCGHPSITTNDFYFCNSDGSTNVIECIEELPLDKLKTYICNQVYEYIFSQIH